MGMKANKDQEIMAALDGIVRMQHTIRGGLDVCVATGLTFIRIRYNAFLKKLEVEGRTTYNYGELIDEVILPITNL